MKKIICFSDLFCYKENTQIQKKIILFIIKLIIILLPIIVGTSMGIIYGKKWNEEKYKNLNKPPLYPPNYIFSIVWPILYIMIGFTYYYILYDWNCLSNKYSKCGISVFYVKSIYFIIPTLALIFNFAYIPVFFSENGLFNGLVVIILALLFAVLTIIQTIILYWDRYGSYKIIIVLLGLIPYIAWLCFATYLSYNLYVLNKKEYMFDENYKN
tara:strand:- start:96 stop:734 length:639 start_codon:yes stop_codon:yes gene_type:complete